MGSKLDLTNPQLAEFIGIKVPRRRIAGGATRDWETLYDKAVEIKVLNPTAHVSFASLNNPSGDGMQFPADGNLVNVIKKALKVVDKADEEAKKSKRGLSVNVTNYPK